VAVALYAVHQLAKLKSVPSLRLILIPTVDALACRLQRYASTSGACYRTVHPCSKSTTLNLQFYETRGLACEWRQSARLIRRIEQDRRWLNQSPTSEPDQERH
jgi:hypothetical protein